MIVGKRKNILAGLLLLILIISVTAATQTFYVNEGDFVTLRTQATDPDNDKITYDYTEPFDQDGEWQTGFDDAGEYEVTITASDGQQETTEKINVVVKNTNQPPLLTANKIEAKEGEEINLKGFVEDPDGDVLIFNFQAPFDSSGRWTPGYQDAGEIITSFSVDDGEFEENKKIEITINNANQPPQIDKIFSESEIVNLNEWDTLKFFVDAYDSDNEKLTYEWKYNNQVVSTTEKGEQIIGFEESGEQELRLLIRDSGSFIEKEWKLVVSNTNRPPQISHQSLQAKEGELIKLNLPVLDDDGDQLSYTYQLPFNENGEWQINYDNEGEHETVVKITDGEFEVEIIVEIVVENIDRAPVLNLPQSLQVNENELLEWKIDTNDPDGDKVTIEILNTPENSQFNRETNQFNFKPSYNYLVRKGGLFSNLLNSLRLEHFFIKKRMVIMNISACAQKLCTSGKVPLIVNNVNRPPAFIQINESVVEETQIVTLKPAASDPDGDIVHYSFTKPLQRSVGKWQTNYDDAGEYEIYVTASDGWLKTTKETKIIVNDLNRKPTIKVNHDSVEVNENQEFTLHLSASDPDNDNLTLTITNLPQGASFVDGVFVWSSDFNQVDIKTDSLWHKLIDFSGFLNRKFSQDSKVRWLEFAVTDGEFEVIHPVKVMIKNVNRPPTVTDFAPQGEIVARVNEPITFTLRAQDLDNDDLNYRWNFGLRQESVVGTDTIQRTFTSAGLKKVEVIVSDERDEVRKQWRVRVLETEEPVEEVSEEPSIFKVFVISG